MNTVTYARRSLPHDLPTRTRRALIAALAWYLAYFAALIMIVIAAGAWGQPLSWIHSPFVRVVFVLCAAAHLIVARIYRRYDMAGDAKLHIGCAVLTVIAAALPDGGIGRALAFVLTVFPGWLCIMGVWYGLWPDSPARGFQP